MNNWERKSSYLLREIIKFRTYIDSLNAAAAEKERLLNERRDANVIVRRAATPTPRMVGIADVSGGMDVEEQEKRLGELQLVQDGRGM